MIQMQAHRARRVQEWPESLHHRAVRALASRWDALQEQRMPTVTQAPHALLATVQQTIKMMLARRSANQYRFATLAKSKQNHLLKARTGCACRASLALHLAPILSMNSGADLFRQRATARRR